MEVACDPAGPLFDYSSVHARRGPASRAAKNVQCIHTTTFLGTSARDCTQDWIMGNCGVSQPIATESFEFFFIEPNSHNACPTLYLSAFENDFPAVKNICCNDRERAANPIPNNYNMGYRQPNKGYIIVICLYI